jgi:hypothetical protein
VGVCIFLFNVVFHYYTWDGGGWGRLECASVWLRKLVVFCNFYCSIDVVVSGLWIDLGGGIYIGWVVDVGGFVVCVFFPI